MLEVRDPHPHPPRHALPRKADAEHNNHDVLNLQEVVWGDGHVLSRGHADLGRPEHNGEVSEVHGHAVLGFRVDAALALEALHRGVPPAPRVVGSVAEHAKPPRRRSSLPLRRRDVLAEDIVSLRGVHRLAPGPEPPRLDGPRLHEGRSIGVPVNRHGEVRRPGQRRAGGVGVGQSEGPFGTEPRRVGVLVPPLARRELALGGVVARKGLLQHQEGRGGDGEGEGDGGGQAAHFQGRAL
mmetsp:Transcript_40755/g.130052  ORF Transcript_40755/g.130052 Transcript_40755/m.130052 type:complete len:239 (+) Transcript_40755:935-1651(+)